MADPLEIIELARGDHRVGVVPGCGAGLSHWRHLRDGAWIELLRPATPAHLRQSGALALGCFPLVPYSGRIRNGRFRFDGQEIRLPLNFGDHPHSIHGQGWQAAWQTDARHTDQIDLTYHHPAGPWPFAYDARQSVKTDDRGLAVSLSVTNRTTRPMPAGLGFHPYFAGARQARLTAQLDGVWFTDDEVMPVDWGPLPQRWDLSSGVAAADMAADNLFTNWQGDALIDRPDLGLRLRLQAGPPLRHLVIYTPPDEEFFCVEPVSHINDAFNADTDLAATGIAVLAPGERLEAAMRIAVEAL